MNILNWLLGKKNIDARTHPETTDCKVATTEGRAAATGTNFHETFDRETDNLQRWSESGRARAWVEAHQGSWNHEDWLALLEELKSSNYWPMQADAVGLVLEEHKREWLQRN